MTNSCRKPEITIKFSEAPTLPAEGKKATIEFVAENKIKIIATFTRKTAAKQLNKTKEFEDWIGAIAGKIEKIEDGVIHLVEGGLQVFEKKKKQPKNDE